MSYSLNTLPLSTTLPLVDATMISSSFKARRKVSEFRIAETMASSAASGCRGRRERQEDEKKNRRAQHPSGLHLAAFLGV